MLNSAILSSLCTPFSLRDLDMFWIYLIFTRFGNLLKEQIIYPNISVKKNKNMHLSTLRLIL
uniref:Uncharacterized protein n=1 Tax=Physcomitrium patens TaxID=3218 RepID=A0A2K1IF15_PHYPA|nr:hypothetical protein PHYPA_028461 [Physcomitrium patens]